MLAGCRTSSSAKDETTIIICQTMAIPSTATSSSFFFFGAVLLSTLFGSTNAAYTQYVCDSGEYCTALAVPLFRRNLQSQSCTPDVTSGTNGSGSGGASTVIPPFRSLEGKVKSQCMAFRSSLVGNGGLCIVTCPSSCVITENVEKPCPKSSAGENTSGGSITGTVESTNTSGGSTTGTSMNISGGTDKFGATEIVCNSGERCTLTASTGRQCSPQLEVSNPSISISPSFGGTYGFSEQCFRIKNSKLVSGGGVCNLSCPSTCKVTKDVSGSVCSTSSGTSSSSGKEEYHDSPASMRALSAITTVVIAGVVAMITFT